MRCRGFMQTWSELDFAVGGNDLAVGNTSAGTYQAQNLLDGRFDEVRIADASLFAQFDLIRR